jgi:hypothetical protein
MEEEQKNWDNLEDWRERQGMNDVPEKTGTEQEATDLVCDPKTGRILPGKTLNPRGRPKGSEDFRLVFRRAIRQLAKVDGKDPDEIYVEIVAKGLQKAHKGDYRFYKDLLDRIHGKPQDRVDLTSDGEKINTGNQIAFVNFAAQKDADDSTSK